MPESTAHDAAVDRTCSLLKAWANRSHNGARIARNLGGSLDDGPPDDGIDPDVAVAATRAHRPSMICRRIVCGKPNDRRHRSRFEIVSGGHPYKDYGWVHEGYAALGATELLVFDPMLLGPSRSAAPYRFAVAARRDRRVRTRAFPQRARLQPGARRLVERPRSPLDISEDRAGTSSGRPSKRLLNKRRSGASRAGATNGRSGARYAEGSALRPKPSANDGGGKISSGG